MGGYAIAKNTLIMLPIFAIHNNEDFWINPESFNPDRFLNHPYGQSEEFAYKILSWLIAGQNLNPTASSITFPSEKDLQMYFKSF